MTIDEIKELIRIVTETGIAELEVARGDSRVRIRRTAGSKSVQEIVLPPVAAVGVAPVAVAPPSPQVSSPAPAIPNAPAGTDEKTVYIKSPIVGTYYESPSPDSPPFVNAGDRVSNGQVLCIIESMKLMNEIESEVSGIVVARLVENGKPVEYGEALFAIQPA